MYSKTSTRRRWLSGLGLALTGVAGCLARGGGRSRPEATADPRPTTVSPRTPGSNTAEPTDSPEPTREPTDTPAHQEPAWWTPSGRVLDSFDAVETDWTVIEGLAQMTDQPSFDGGPAVSLDSAGANRFRIERRFDAPRDFTDVGFSMAVCLHATTRDLVQVNLTLIDTAGDQRALSGSIQPGATDRWMRFDLGVRDDRGADMSEVAAMRIGHWSGTGETSVTVDDIRVHPKPDIGYVMFTFDDGPSGDYTVAYPALDRHGYAGACFPPIAWVTEDSSPSIAEYREMRDDGWDIGGHTLKHEDLTELSRSEQRDNIAENYRQLHDKDLAREITHFRTPFSRYDTHSLDLMTESFDTSIIGAGSATGTNLAITDPRTIGFRSGDQLEEAKGLVDAAVEYRQLLGFTLHMNSIDDGHLAELVDYVNEYDRQGLLRVITPTQLYREFMED